MLNPFRGRRRLLVLAAAAAGLAVGVFVVVHYVVPWRQHGRVVALVAEFRANPTPETTDRLIDIMEAGTSDDDADRILLALLRPRVMWPVRARVGEPVDVPLGCGDESWSENIVAQRDPSQAVLFVHFAESLLTVEDPSHPDAPLQSVAACSTRVWDPWQRFHVVFGDPRPRRTEEKDSRGYVLTKAGRYHGTVRMTFFWQKIGPLEPVAGPPSLMARVRNWFGAIFWGRGERGLDHACVAEFPVEIVVEDASRPSPDTD